MARVCENCEGKCVCAEADGNVCRGGWMVVGEWLSGWAGAWGGGAGKGGVGHGVVTQT